MTAQEPDWLVRLLATFSTVAFGLIIVAIAVGMPLNASQWTALLVTWLGPAALIAARAPRDW